MDIYTSYDDLKKGEKEGEDYIILLREADSPIALLAPHGGGIEPGTVDIADAVASDEYSFYAFKGTKLKGNRLLHITSNRFDEPNGLRVARKSDIAISIHGCHIKDEIVYIGGKDKELKERIMHTLNRAGFKAEIDTKPGLRAQHPENICNRGRSGKGVQLEISRGLREKIFDNLDRRSWRKKNRLFFEFVDSLKKCLHSITRPQRDGLLRTT